MNMNSFFLILVLVFVRVQGSSVSPTATYVDQIDQLVGDAQKRHFTAEFFKDPQNLKILNRGVQNDSFGVLSVFINFWNDCCCFEYTTLEPNIFDTHLKKIKFYTKFPSVEFKMENFIRDLSTFLTTYDIYFKNGHITNGKSMDEMVEMMIDSLNLLDPRNWDEEFFAKLQKAFKNEDFHKVDIPEKVDDTGNKNDGIKGNVGGNKDEKTEKNGNKPNGGSKNSQKGKRIRKVDTNVNAAIKIDSGGNENNESGNIGYYIFFAILIVLNLVVLFVILFLRYKK
jgi:hypothetical protein